MEHLKDGLSQLQKHLTELEASARKLPNQNFADIIKSARGRLAQAAEHPDLDAVHEQLRAGHECDPRFEPQRYDVAHHENVRDQIGAGSRAFEPGKGDFKEPAFDPSAGNTDTQTYG